MDKIYGFKLVNKNECLHLDIREYEVIEETESTIKLTSEFGGDFSVFKYELDNITLNLEVFSTYTRNKEKAIELTKKYLVKQLQEARHTIEKKVSLLNNIVSGQVDFN